MCCRSPGLVAAQEPPVFNNFQLSASGARIAIPSIDGIAETDSRTGDEMLTCKNEDRNTPRISVVETIDGSVARLRGRIDMDSSPVIREGLLALLRYSNTGTIHVDLSGVTSMDTSGIATLIEALKLARRRGAELRLQGLDEPLAQMFEFTGILSLFNGSRR